VEHTATNEPTRLFYWSLAALLIGPLAVGQSLFTDGMSPQAALHSMTTPAALQMFPFLAFGFLTYAWMWGAANSTIILIWRFIFRKKADIAKAFNFGVGLCVTLQALTIPAYELLVRE
jgi:hypothetical protein